MTKDPLFRVKVLSKTLDPATLVWQAMHQDYSEDFVFDEEPPNEKDAGDLIIKHLLKGGRGHFGPMEHPSITFACGHFPHSVMQQARTHRVGVSFDVQSMRYTGQRIARHEHTGDWADTERLFYLRPCGFYTDRQGNKYEYTTIHRGQDLVAIEHAIARYKDALEKGFAEEHARGLLPFDFRQHFVVTFNLRSLMHFLDLRAKLDAQWEIQQMCELMMPHFEEWIPSIYHWYKETRWAKARLAP